MTSGGVTGCAGCVEGAADRDGVVSLGPDAAAAGAWVVGAGVMVLLGAGGMVLTGAGVVAGAAVAGVMALTSAAAPLAAGAAGRAVGLAALSSREVERDACSTRSARRAAWVRAGWLSAAGGGELLLIETLWAWSIWALSSELIADLAESPACRAEVVACCAEALACWVERLACCWLAAGLGEVGALGPGIMNSAAPAPMATTTTAGTT